MAQDEFSSMGCGGLNDEWQCVEHLGQDAADQAFKKHWDTWTTQDDIKQIAGLGLNTVRIPVGFWLKEDLVKDTEHYPRGGVEYLDRLVGWCKDNNIYVIMDLHGGPGSQFPNQQYTGHVCIILLPQRDTDQASNILYRASPKPVSTTTTTMSAPPNSSNG